MNTVHRTCHGASAPSASPERKCLGLSKARKGRRRVGRRLTRVSRRARAQRGDASHVKVSFEPDAIPTVVLERPKTSHTAGVRVILLPTAHVSERSALDADEVIRTNKPDVVLLEVCDERIDGVIDRMKGVDNDNVVVPGAVHIDGMPAGILPGGVDEVGLLSRLRTKVGKGVSMEDLKSDAELLLRTGLFESVIVRGSAEDEHGARTVVWKEGKVTLMVSVSEIVFTVHPMGAELTSDIRFKWNVHENFASATSDATAEVEVMRRAGELVKASDCASGEGEMSAWQTAALCASLVISVQEKLQSGYTVALDVSDGECITLDVVPDVALSTDGWFERIDVDLRDVLSISFIGEEARAGANKSSQLTVKIMNGMMTLAESTISNKLDAQDGGEIVAGLSAAFESRTSRVYLADAEVSKTMRSLEEKLHEHVPGTKRSFARYILGSIRSVITSVFKTRKQLTTAIETERLTLMRSGEVSMPPHMREVFIDERDSVLFDCLWSVIEGKPTDRPGFYHSASSAFEYARRVPALDLPADGVSITVVFVLGAAHVPGIVRRWNEACSRD